MNAESGPIRLEMDRPVVRDLAGGGSHEYLLHVEAGQYLRLTADQRGIDVKLHLKGPGDEDSAPIRDLDSPVGDQGPETLSIVAEVAGEYRARVFADEKEKPGQYEIRLDELRKATDQDRTRVAAEEVFLEGEALRRQKDWQGALTRYERSLEIWRSLGDPGGEARALYWAGKMHEGLEDAGLALTLAEQALAKYRQAGDTRGEAMTLNRRGTLLMNQKSVEALAAFSEAVKIAESGAYHRIKLSALNNAGLIHMEAGRTSQAIELLYEASRIARSLEDPKQEAKIQINLGLLFFNQNRPDDAREALEAARQAAEAAGEQELLAQALGYLGEIDQREGHLAEARTELARALEIQRELKDESGEAASLASLGTAQLKAGELESAWETNQAMLALSRKLKREDNEAIALSNLGRIHYARGEDAEAVARQREARALFERVADRQGMAAARFGAARSLVRMGNLAEARQELEPALDLVEELRGESPGLDFRASFFASKQHYWDLYIHTLMRLAERQPVKRRELTALALETAERRRARGLLDALAGTRERLESEADPEVAAELREVEQRLSLAEARRNAAIKNGADPEILKASDSEVRILLTRQDLLRAKLRDLSSRFAELSRPEPLDVHAIQKLLDVNTLLLVYSLGEDRSYLWTVSKRSLTGYALPERERIEEVARQLTESLSRSSQEGQAQARRSAEALSSLVLGQAAERISGFSRLLVVADGALQAVPFAALPDPTRADEEPEILLVEGHEITYLPSVSVLASLRERAHRARKPSEQLRVAVIADPAFRSGGGTEVAMTRSLRDLGITELKPLPFARQEGEAIVAMIQQGLPFSAFGFDATRELFTGGGLRDFHVIHIATHSLMDSRRPEMSGIALSMVDEAGKPRDGFLRLHEIYELDLKANLVVLSACQTGVGRDVRGEGLQGLARGFLYAGVPRLVVSLWKVDDRSTAELMKRFYFQLLSEGLPPAEALRRAQLSMLREPEWSHPRHWAGFIFIGDFQLKSGGLEEEETGGTVVAKKATSDLPPPKVAPDKPKKKKKEESLPGNES